MTVLNHKKLPQINYFSLAIVPILFLVTISARLSCRIESYSCNFPFRHNGIKRTSCISPSDIDTSDDDGGNDYFCKQSRGSPSEGVRVPGGLGWSWGVCDDGCFETGSDCELGLKSRFIKWTENLSID